MNPGSFDWSQPRNLARVQFPKPGIENHLHAQFPGDDFRYFARPFEGTRELGVKAIFLES